MNKRKEKKTRKNRTINDVEIKGRFQLLGKFPL